MRARVFGCLGCCLACVSSDGTQRCTQFLLVDKVEWISIKKKKQTEDVCPDIFNIQGAFFIPQLRC